MRVGENRKRMERTDAIEIKLKIVYKNDNQTVIKPKEWLFHST
jgi:hypothetical protein